MKLFQNEIALDSRVLLAVYAIIPLSVLVLLADYFLFGHAIRNFLPYGPPEQLVWWTLVFNLPHIVGSFVTYADRDYLKSYRGSLAKGVLVSAVLLLACGFAFGDQGQFVLFALYTMYHVLMQQYGIALMLLKRGPDWSFRIWKWLTIAGAGLIYLYVYSYTGREYALFGIGLDDVGVALFTAGCIGGIPMLVSALRSTAASRVSKWYFVATYLLGPASLAAYFAGYTFLLVLIPRFTHDVTAFIVYAVHDHNRNREACKNFLYKPVRGLKIPVLFLNFPVAVLISAGLTMTQTSNIFMAYFVTIIIFLHYYMEGHMWKRGSLHRQYTPFKIA